MVLRWCVSYSYNQTVFGAGVIWGLDWFDVQDGFFNHMLGVSDGMAEQLAKPLYLFSLCGFSIWWASPQDNGLRIVKFVTTWPFPPSRVFKRHFQEIAILFILFIDTSPSIRSPVSSSQLHSTGHTGLTQIHCRRD